MNGDGGLDWDEFTGFVIDQVLAMTAETPNKEAFRERDLAAFNASDRLLIKFPIAKCSFVPGLGGSSCTGRVLIALGPLIQVNTANQTNGNTHTCMVSLNVACDTVRLSYTSKRAPSNRTA